MQSFVKSCGSFKFARFYKVSRSRLKYQKPGSVCKVVFSRSKSWRPGEIKDWYHFAFILNQKSILTYPILKIMLNPLTW